MASVKKKLAFSAAAFLLVLLAGEIGLRIAYFQMKSGSNFAWVALFRLVQQEVDLHEVNRERKQMAELLKTIDGSWEALYGEEPWEQLLGALKREYAAHFDDLARSCAKAQTKLVILYLPWTDGRSTAKFTVSQSACRPFFESQLESTVWNSLT